jgi:hypothetical protein
MFCSFKRASGDAAIVFLLRVEPVAGDAGCYPASGGKFKRGGENLRMSATVAGRKVSGQVGRHAGQSLLNS